MTGTGTGTGTGDSGLASLGSSFFLLIVVLVLLGGVAYVARRLRGRVDKPGGAGARIKILAARPIGWQCSLIVVEAEGRRFLVGAGRQGLTAIGRLDGPEAADDGGAVV